MKKEMPIKQHTPCFFKINYELKHILLSYADSITILSPQSLIDRHIEALKEALGRYGEEK
ncbi:MAG: hypothetical protein IKO34_07990 [Bacteroidales bacterium]|nr:hypothetical protein [Bacteroidales bacterium]